MAKALGDPVRLQLVDVLRKHAGKVCVCELVPLFEISQPTLSHHLKKLREAGIVDSERREYERSRGRLTDRAFLEALIGASELAWLGPLTSLIVRLEEAVEERVAHRAEGIALARLLRGHVHHGRADLHDRLDRGRVTQERIGGPRGDGDEAQAGDRRQHAPG